MIGSPEISKNSGRCQIAETESPEHRDDKATTDNPNSGIKLLKELNNPITFHILDDLRAHSQNISSNEEFKLSNLLGWIDASTHNTPLILSSSIETALFTFLIWKE